MKADLALILMVIGATLALFSILLMLFSIFGQISDARDKILEEIRKVDNRVEMTLWAIAHGLVEKP